MTEIILDPGGGNEKTITESEIYRVPDATRVHTGLSTYRASIKTSFSDTYPYAQRQNRINVKINGAVQWTGYVVDAKENVREPGTIIEADGIAKRLEETRPDYASLGGSLTITSKPLDTAIDDYWDRTPFSNHSVTSQSTESVVSGETIDSASTNAEFNDVLSFDDDEPVEIRNDAVELLQCTYLEEAEDATLSANATTETALADFSGAAGVKLDSAGESVTFTFTPEYDLPDGAYDASYYRELNNFDGTVELFLNGTSVVSSTFGDATGGPSQAGADDLNQGTLQKGNSQDLKVEITDHNAGYVIVDFLFLTDLGERFSDDFNIDTFPTFDSNSSTYDGPELYPEEYLIEFSTQTVSYNVTLTDLDSTWGASNNTQNKQRISASNDGGSSYLTASNTTDSDFDHQANSQFGRQPKIRMRLGRFTFDPTTTPSEGDDFQSVESYTHKVDGNNRVVIDKLELDQNHFDNLQTLHEYGDFLWTIEHSDETVGNMTVKSYQRGDETRATPDGVDDPVDKRPEVLAGLYANTIYLQGAQDSNGNRPTAEVQADSSIRNNDDRDDITIHLRDPSVTTEGGAAFRARSFLDFAQTRDKLYGTITIPAVDYVHPGYAYSVDFGNGKADKTLEKISLSEDPNDYTIDMRFSVAAGLIDEVSRLKQNFRNSQSQI